MQIQCGPERTTAFEASAAASSRSEAGTPARATDPQVGNDEAGAVGGLLALFTFSGFSAPRVTASPIAKEQEYAQGEEEKARQ